MTTILESVVSVYGDQNEDSIFAANFATFPEAVAGQTITAATVEYQGKPTTAPALTLPATTTVAGVIVGTQVQVEARPAAACAGYLYSFTFTATFSGGNHRVVRGLLSVTGPS